MILSSKKIGETPLDVIKKLKANNPDLKKVKMAYAGRLDPMAEGLLLILIGDECKNREEFENLPKTYEFEVLFGVSTDTYDVLGKIVNSESLAKITSPDLEKILQTLTGKFEQPYPPYSAARVNGKPLYFWAREGLINTIKIPTKNVEIFSLKLISLDSVDKNTLKDLIFEKLSHIKGEFRQEEIKEVWESYFQKSEIKSYPVAKFTIECSSGTYVRSLANKLGILSGTNSIALSIKRTSIGSYK